MTQIGEKYNWISSVPYGWKLVKLKYLSSISTGVYDTQDKLEDGAYPFFVRSPHVERIDKYSHDCEAVMTAGDGVGVGKVFHYYNGKFAAHQRVYVFNQFKNNVNGKYIYYSLMSNLKLEVLQGNAKSTVDSLRYPMLSNFPILLPSSSTQNIIVDFLERKTSEIDALISDKEKLISLLEEKRQAIISEAVTKGLDPGVKMKDSGVEWIGEIPFNWNVIQIKWLTSVKRGASPRPIDDPKYFDEFGKFGWVRISDVTKSNKYLLNTEQKLSKLGSDKSVKLKKGDLFLSIAGSVGKPCITNINCCIHDGFVYFPEFKENTDYLYYIFETKKPYQGLGKLGTQLNLNTDTVGKIKIPLPSRETQERIVEYIEKSTKEIDELLTQYSQSVRLLKEYRQALIYEAVTGKIDVQEMLKETEQEEVSSS